MQVDILKGEAERQSLQREELELELHALKNKMHNVESTDADVKRFVSITAFFCISFCLLDPFLSVADLNIFIFRHLDEKARNLQDALNRIKILEKDLANKDIEVYSLASHYLNLEI